MTHTLTLRDTQKAWSHPGWAHERRGRHGVTKPLTEEGLCVCLCACDPTLEADPPLLRTSATARHHIPMVTPLLSLLIKIREIYLCVHTHTHAHTESQQVAGLARHSRPTSKVKHTADRPLFLCCSPKGEGEKVRRRGQDKKDCVDRGDIKGSVSMFMR